MWVTKMRCMYVLLFVRHVIDTIVFVALQCKGYIVSLKNLMAHLSALDWLI